MNKLFILLILMLGFVFAANAQIAKMSSVFTNMQTDCKAESKVEADEVPFVCKAVGGYRVRIVPAGAQAEMVEIIDKKGEMVASIAQVGYGYSTTKNRKVEWRMANGKPFAVIFRIFTFDSEKAIEAGDNPYLLKYKTDEKLVVRGLPGHGQIDLLLEGKGKNANLNAQKKADENFQ